MTFVAVLIGGITLSISTCLKVWDRSRETADLNQEARAAIEVLSRDIRGAYLGRQRQGGYFLAGGGTDNDSTGMTLEFTTESSTVTRAALMPELHRGEASEQIGPPATDFVAVRYELQEGSATDRSGLYRTSWLVPEAAWLQEGPPGEAVAKELISEAVVGVAFQYYDGMNWLDSWATTADNLGLPQAISVELTLLDARSNEHVYQSVISVPTR